MPSIPERVMNINVGVLGHVDSGKTSLGKQRLGLKWWSLTVLSCLILQWLPCPPRCQQQLLTNTLKAKNVVLRWTWDFLLSWLVFARLRLSQHCEPPL